MFIGEILSVSTACQGLGLGSELCRRSVELAKSKGYTSYSVIASGLYSQRAFHKLGFEEKHRVVYKDERDKNGNLVVWDHREHTHAETLYKAL